jgi:hypothetical protein
MSVEFPSVAFFEALRHEMQGERDRFSRLGFFDTTFGVRVVGEGAPPADFTLAFEVFDCTGVQAGTSPGADFTLEGPLVAWREMLDAIHRLGAADTAHSINTLTHFGEGLHCRYDDPDGHDKLYRFAESIQEYFNLTARIDFRYPDGSKPPAPEATAARSAS